MERIAAYIDGYNLYFGLLNAGYSRYKWLNVRALVQSLLKPGQELVQVNYFTTLVTNDIDARERQKNYIDALQTEEMIRVIFGKFKKEKHVCKSCGNSFLRASEKMTDAAIVTTMISDFYADRFDTAMLISGDTDLIPPVRFINELNTDKRVMVAFPPMRVNDEVRKAAKGSLVIGRKKLADSQFPDTVITNMGHEVYRPALWT